MHMINAFGSRPFVTITEELRGLMAAGKCAKAATTLQEKWRTQDETRGALNAGDIARTR